jgi:hypothetical protein
MKFDREDFMAKKKRKASLKPVVKAIARTTRQLKRIRAHASPAEKKRLDLKIKAVENLKVMAYRICKLSHLNIY